MPAVIYIALLYRYKVRRSDSTEQPYSVEHIGLCLHDSVCCPPITHLHINNDLTLSCALSLHRTARGRASSHSRVSASDSFSARSNRGQAQFQLKRTFIYPNPIAWNTQSWLICLSGHGSREPSGWSGCHTVDGTERPD